MDHAENFEKIEDFLQKKLDESGAEGFILGLSGGIDSATLATTVVKAFGSEKLTCWVMPGAPSDRGNMEDARKLAEELGVELREVSISPVIEKMEEEVPFETEELAKGNARARIRMVYQYMEANQSNRLVLGSGNRSEVLLGYFTKYGDAAVDVMPLGDLYKTELREFARYIGVDEKFIEKAPTAGLWEGQTDESEMGVSYEEADRILRKMADEEVPIEELAESDEFDREKVERVAELHAVSEHKREMPSYPELR